MKARRQPIAMVTAYDAPSGRFADAAGIDIVLVGDSAAMVVLGHDSTVPATIDEMLMLTRAVTRGARRPVVVADMPFGSFQVSDEEALGNAIRFVKEAGADAVKVEGAGRMLSRVQALVEAGIPVIGHIGLTPQTATMLGGFKAQGARPRKRCSSSTTRSRSRRQAASRSCSRPFRPRCYADHRDAHDPDNRDRRRRGLRRPSARLARPARSLRGARATIREAVRRSRRRRSSKRSARSSRKCASAASRRNSTPTRCPRTSSPSSRRRYRDRRDNPHCARRQQLEEPPLRQGSTPSMSR